MSTQPRSDSDNHSSESGEAIQVYSLLVHDIAAPLTVIKGHAQLIRRRATRGTREETVLLERSIAAIELAVHRILMSMAKPVRKLPAKER